MTLSLLLTSLLVGLVMSGEPVGVEKMMNLVMPGAKPDMNDAYLCSSFDVSQMTGDKVTVHVTGFIPKAEANKAHHMLLYSCDEPNEMPGKVYDCLHHSMCRGGQSIMFAWAKNAPPTTLPKGVSAAINPNQRRYLVLQIHYAHPLPEPDNTGLSLQYQVEPTKYTSGILLLMRGNLNIPANTPVTHGDVNCKLPSSVPLHMFAYRTHAHALSPVITGYVYNETGHQYREIARGSPQWPQAFYPMKRVQTVSPGEIVAARCTYNSTGISHNTHIGSTAGDEMCNLYIMFFTEPGKVGDYLVCGNEQEGHDITRGLPEDSDLPPQQQPDLEAHAMDGSKGNGSDEINYAQLFDDELLEGSSKKKGGLDNEGTIMTAWYNFTIPGAKPDKDDYICTGVKIADLERDSSLWAVEFSAIATGNRAHHMIVSKCKQPKELEAGKTWDCRHHAMCDDNSKIMFAWAKHAAPTKLPNDVGFQLAKDDFLVLQVHYQKPLPNPDHSGISIRVVTTKPRYTAGMFLLLRSQLNIPPDTPVIHGDANCQAPIKSPIHVFAYRTHAHSLGTVISGYRYTPKDKHWEMVAKGNPMWPQAFYPMDQEMTVNPGEVLAARCTYNTVGHHTNTNIGSAGGDEMCNLYLMYYTLTAEDDFKVCVDEQNPGLTSQLPDGNDTPLPPNPVLEQEARGEVQNTVSYSNGLPDSPLQMPEKKGGGSVKKRPGVDNGSVKKKPGVELLGSGAPSVAVPTPNFPPQPTPQPSISKSETGSGVSQMSDSLNAMASKVLPGGNVNSSVVLAAAISVPLSLILALCLFVRRCRKRGRGALAQSGGVSGGSKNKFKDWNVGDILGRNKDGFKPVRTDERDAMLDDDSDSEVEEFSIPANHA